MRKDCLTCAYNNADEEKIAGLQQAYEQTPQASRESFRNVIETAALAALIAAITYAIVTQPQKKDTQSPPKIEAKP